MKILVLGAAGFIGSHVCECLLKKNYEVVGLDNFLKGKPENISHLLGEKNFSFIKGDIFDENFFEQFAHEKFSAIVHLAGQTMVNKGQANPYFDAQENILGTIKVLELAKKNQARVIFSSTAAAYGDVPEKDLPIHETRPVQPQSFYGLSKCVAEKYFQLFAEHCHVEYVIFRFANVYGERQGSAQEGGVISLFCRAIANHQSLKIFGDGLQTRDFIYVGDIAQGIVQALSAAPEFCNTVYNLSTQTEINLLTLIQSLEKISQKKIAVNYFPANQGDILKSSLSNEKAKKNLSWQPSTTLQEGLQKTYEFCLNEIKK